MIFTSWPFILLVLLSLALYYLLPKSKRWICLLVTSYIFYLFAGAECLIFIVYTTAVTYLTSIWLQKRCDSEEAFLNEHRETMPKPERKAYAAKQKKIRFRILVGGLILGFGMLAVLKYTSFVVSTIVDMGAELTVPRLILPLGISFYTFQSMGYLIDVYRKKGRAEKNPFRLALFVSFFPQLLQGPISRYGDLAPQLYEGHSFQKEAFFGGILRTVWGFFKKVVIADAAMIAVKTMVTNSMGGAYTLLLILVYSIVIYGDFTGGIDITIGVSELFGIRLRENFDRPFSSRSVKEYWKRWHITMGTWFSDYVFYPLSISSPMQKLSKWSRAHLGAAVGKRLPMYIATVVTWFLTGLWHGAGWNFIVWGLLNCLIILISQECKPLWEKWEKAAPRVAHSKAFGCFQAVRTFLLMGWIRSLDCYRDVPLTFRLWGSVFTEGNYGELLSGGFLKLGLTGLDWTVIGVGVLLMFAVSQIGKKEPIRYRLVKRPVLYTAVLTAAILGIILFGTYGIGYDAGDFIYGQF